LTKFRTIPEVTGLHCCVSSFHFYASVAILGKPYCWVCAGEVLGVKPEVAVRLYRARTRSVVIKVPEGVDQVVVRDRIERLGRANR